MSVPQKEGPASMLRAMFAGVGSLLSVVDKVRGKTAANAPTGAETPATAAQTAAAEPQPAAPATVAVETVTPETVAAETTAEPAQAAEPETVVAETVTPETVTPETSAAPETSPAPGAAPALPLANYDELSVASLRARLRSLSVASLTQLIEYEKGHAARPDVISMFERRIAKVETEA
jgi:hypothetical protein